MGHFSTRKIFSNMEHVIKKERKRERRSDQSRILEVTILINLEVLITWWLRWWCYYVIREEINFPRVWREEGIQVINMFGNSDL
jgi:hypothetical protein